MTENPIPNGVGPKKSRPNIFTKARRKITPFLPKPKVLASTLGVALLIFLVYSFAKPTLNFINTFLRGPSSIISFTQDPRETLESTNGRTNTLLLGMGGEGHEGALLTDSMMIVSYNHDTKIATLISIPRDLWIDSLKTKVNATYFYGEQRQEGGGGLLLAKSAVSELTGLPIHYGFAINFDGFKEAIDLVDGVDVHIDTTFDDYKYPIPGMEDAYPEELRYEHLRFEAGLEHMNGDRALKFSRSRNAEGDEGTDFARSQRQQKIMMAFLDKVISTDTFLKPQRIDELIDLYKDYIDTDILDTEYSSFAKMVILMNKEDIRSIALTTGDEQEGELGILENPTDRRPYDGQYVLIARDGNWDALKQYIQNNLENN